MVPSKFGVNWPFGSGEEAKNRFSRWRPWWPSWISDRNDFSYFWSTSHPDASYQVSSQLAQGYRRSRLLKQLLTPHDGRRTTHDGRRTTDDGHWLTTIAHHEHFVLRWAKKASLGEKSIKHIQSPCFITMVFTTEYITEDNVIFILFFSSPENLFFFFYYFMFCFWIFFFES